MEEDASTWCVGALVAVIGLVGIVLAAGARDDGMYVFGWSLLGFAAAFIFGLMRRTLEKGEADHG